LTSDTNKEDQMGAWRAFLWANTVLMRRMEARLEEQGLPIAFFDVLIHLYEAEGGRMRMQALAASIVLSPSGLTRLVDRMERAGLVQRQSYPEDRRGLYVAITAAGRAAFERVWPLHEQDILDLFGRHLPTEEIPSFRGVLERLIAANDPAKNPHVRQE
jgi:DNA-binding MarR family transcriptional regulator